MWTIFPTEMAYKTKVHKGDTMNCGVGDEQIFVENIAKNPSPFFGKAFIHQVLDMWNSYTIQHIRV